MTAPTQLSSPKHFPEEQVLYPAARPRQQFLPCGKAWSAEAAVGTLQGYLLYVQQLFCDSCKSSQPGLNSGMPVINSISPCTQPQPKISLGKKSRAPDSAIVVLFMLPSPRPIQHL